MNSSDRDLLANHGPVAGRAHLAAGLPTPSVVAALEQIRAEVTARSFSEFLRSPLPTRGDMTVILPPYIENSRLIEDWEASDYLAGRFGEGAGKGGQVTYQEVRRHRCEVLGTWDPVGLQWTWEVETPLFSEAIFDLGTFACGMNAAFELAQMCAARLEADWLFVEELEPGGTRLFAAVKD